MNNKQRASKIAQRLERANLRSQRGHALERITRIVERNVKIRTPVQRGTLRRSIAGDVVRVGERAKVGSNLPYARAVNDGTRAHDITPRNATVLAFRPGQGGGGAGVSKTGSMVFTRRVRHPGTKPNPFLENGLNDSRGEIRDVLSEAGIGFLAGRQK